MSQQSEDFDVEEDCPDCGELVPGFFNRCPACQAKDAIHRKCVRNRRFGLFILLAVLITLGLLCFARPARADAPYFVTIPDISGNIVWPGAISRNGQYVTGLVSFEPWQSNGWRWSRPEGLTLLPAGDHAWPTPDEVGSAARNNGIIGGSSYIYPTEWMLDGATSVMSGDWDQAESHARVTGYSLGGSVTIGEWHRECDIDWHLVWDDGGLHIIEEEGHFNAVSRDGGWAAGAIERGTPDPCDPDLDGHLWDLSTLTHEPLEAPAGIDTLAQAALDLSEFAEVVVGSTWVPSWGGVGSIWHGTEHYEIVPGAKRCVSVSADGTRITCETDNTLYGRQAVLYAQGEITALRDLGIAAGLPLQGWHLGGVDDADDLAMTWTGRCQSPTGENMAYILHVPEPGSLALLTVGLYFTRRKRT